MNSNIWILLVLLLFISINHVNAFFGGKKDKENKKDDISAKETLALGIESMMKNANDPQALKEIQDMLKDPEAMAEVQKLMKDPSFVKEIEKLKENPLYQNAMQQAAELYQDPQRAAEILEMKRQAEAQLEEQLSDAELGIRELQKAAKNPKMLAEAMVY